MELAREPRVFIVAVFRALLGEGRVVWIKIGGLVVAAPQSRVSLGKLTRQRSQLGTLFRVFGGLGPVKTIDGFQGVLLLLHIHELSLQVGLRRFLRVACVGLLLHGSILPLFGLARG